MVQRTRRWQLLRRAAVVLGITLAATAIPSLAPAAPAHPDVLPQRATGVPVAKQTRGVSSEVVAQAKKYAPGANFTATWKRADALKVRPDSTTTTPRIPENFPVMTDKVWVWDTWPLTGLDTKPMTYKGWHVIFSLVAPRNIFFGDRHWEARIGYFYSKDGRNWKYGGHLFPDGYSKGSREWAGTAIYTSKGTVTQFYTASGRDNGGINNTDFLQRLAMSSGKIHADSKGVYFTGFRKHKIIAQADGKYYQTQEQSKGAPIIYAFRDPYVFRDPKDKKIYALFEGNTAGVAGTYQCKARDLGKLPPGHTVSSDANLYTGNIGLMRATNGTKMSKWKLLPPLLSTNCVNQQTERPHMVIKNGTYYLFTISHQFTYAPGLSGPDGVYGFAGPSLRSDYKPLNGSALVLGNPPDAPIQNYSHEVMPNLIVQSFIDTVPGANGPVYGGTLAPSLQLAINGTNTYLTRVLPYAYIPSMKAVK
ncbi:glycoside hydrolase family 68 protein [Microlunatus ginsengisoli]|uniref:Glycoside hydrolase family 68 protein n=1 Tax=Microlunatus ginsengisoli TaxID=363863 RepID=A0ABP7AVX6_9ACTN